MSKEPATVRPAGADMKLPVIVNLTPHDVRVLDRYGDVVAEYQPSGMVARIEEDREPTGALPDGAPTERVRYGRAYDLPAHREDHLLIVSRVLAGMRPYRTDLVFPSREVRDEQGRVVGCRALGSLHER